MNQSENSESVHWSDSGAVRQLVSPTKNIGQVSDSSVVRQMIYSLIEMPRSKRTNLCDKKGWDTGKKNDYSVYIGRGKAKVKETGQPEKSDVPGGAWGDGGRTI